MIFRNTTCFILPLTIAATAVNAVVQELVVVPLHAHSQTSKFNMLPPLLVSRHHKPNSNSIQIFNTRLQHDRHPRRATTRDRVQTQATTKLLKAPVCDQRHVAPPRKLYSIFGSPANKLTRLRSPSTPRSSAARRVPLVLFDSNFGVPLRCAPALNLNLTFEGPGNNVCLHAANDATTTNTRHHLIFRFDIRRPGERHSMTRRGHSKTRGKGSITRRVQVWVCKALCGPLWSVGNIQIEDFNCNTPSGSRASLVSWSIPFAFLHTPEHANPFCLP
ncbi:hypothetical protein C8R43DRAFT_1183220 [Mycena crocata]|nr:hypothetical protein C8R43DRAFT_1183220 [Mycena crocata]